MVFGGHIGCNLGFSGSAVAIYVQVGDVRTQVVAVATEAIDKRLDTLEKDQEDIRNYERQILQALGRVEAKQNTAPAPLPNSISLTDAETTLVRQLIGVPPVTGSPSRLSIGDSIPSSASKPIPPELVAKVSQLKDVRFVVDPTSNAVALIDTAVDGCGEGRFSGGEHCWQWVRYS
jgi:hypothetical protein